MLRYFQQNVSVFEAFFPTFGIAVGGFSISLFYLIHHRITSKDISYWRAYMRLLEYKDSDIKEDWLSRPWELMHSYAKEHDKGNFYSALRRYPGPLLWLVLPIIFTTAWFIGLL